MRVEEINPYNDNQDKGNQVEEMFDSIAPSYDFMNTAMSFGLHRRWRNKALNATFDALRPISPYKGIAILDVATGTGDVAFRLAEIFPRANVTGIDLSEGMLSIARKKLSELSPDFQSRMAFGKGDSLMMPFQNEEFDVITVAYGVRNFSDLKKGLQEMKRTLKPEGVLTIIELSCPQGFLSAPLYRLYSRRFIPFLGKLVSKDTRAYSYLPESIEACPQREDMAALLRDVGFQKIEWKQLSFGAVTYYIAR